MTTIAADRDKLRELDEDTRRAWARYAERTSALDGADYDQAELESWTVLQGELKRLERRRRLLLAPSA